MIKAFIDVYNDIKTEILAKNPNLVLQPGSAINDIFINPESIELSKQTIIEDYVSRLQSLDEILASLNDQIYLALVAYSYGRTVDDITADLKTAINNHASNYDITKKPSTYASGIVYFGRDTILTISDGDKTVLRGTIVQAINGQQYQTTSDVIMYWSLGSTYFDPDLLLYVIPVPVQALTIGSAGNQIAQSINKIVSSVNGFIVVINKDEFSNGVDEETDEDLIGRIKLVYTGNNLGSRDGYKKLILEKTPITDVYVAYAGDPFMIRDLGYGGAIDIYILENNIIQTGETVSIVETYHNLIKQPVDSLVSITGHGGATYALEPNNIEIYEGSILANARIHWLTAPTTPYVITYNYNANVETVQNLVEQDVNRILAGKDKLVLIKQSIKVPIDISFLLSVFSGYTKSTVIDNIRTALTNYINVLKLGAKLEQSDVISKVTTIAGVDKVTLPMTKFNRTILTGVVDTINVEGREYIRLQNLNIS